MPIVYVQVAKAANFYASGKFATTTLKGQAIDPGLSFTGSPQPNFGGSFIMTDSVSFSGSIPTGYGGSFITSDSLSFSGSPD